MKTTLMILLAAVLALSGCSTVDSRIREKSASFQSLDPQTQGRLREGVIHVGDTTDMVYIALGKPDRVRERASNEGTRTTWIYNTTYEEYEGRHVVGYQRRTVVDRRNGVAYSYVRPVRAEVYEEYTDEYLRVVFNNGLVTAIEREDLR